MPRFAQPAHKSEGLREGRKFHLLTLFDFVFEQKCVKTIVFYRRKWPELASGLHFEGVGVTIHASCAHIRSTNGPKWRFVASRCSFGGVKRGSTQPAHKSYLARPDHFEKSGFAPQFRRVGVTMYAFLRWARMGAEAKYGRGKMCVSLQFWRGRWPD